MYKSWDLLLDQLKKSKTVFQYLTVGQVENMVKDLKEIEKPVLSDHWNELMERKLRQSDLKISVLTFLIIALLEMKEAEYNVD